MPILIPAVDIYTDELCVFSNNTNKNIKSEINYINDIDIGTAVQASCSYPGIFSPEYVYGYINPDTEEIEENTIPISDRKKYKYQFLNGQITCVDDRIKY